MREKHMRKKIGNMRKWSNFVKKKNDDDGTKINEFES